MLKQAIDLAPTHDVDVEAGTIACNLLKCELIQLHPLPLDYFHVPQYRELYSVMLELDGEGIPCDDLAILVDRVTRRGFDRGDFAPLIASLLKREPNAFNFEYYRGILATCFERRKLESLASEQTSLLQSGADNATIQAMLIRRTSEIEGGTGGRSKGFDAFSCADLLDSNQTRDWLLPGVLTRFEPALIVGPSKSLKTSFAVDLCATLATGGSFLGNFPAERSFRVGIMSGESGPQTLTDLSQRWSRAAGVDLRSIENLVWSFKIPNLADPASMLELRRWIRSNSLEVVLFDPLYLMAPGADPSSVFAMGAMLRELASLCLDTGATPILCHHTKKSIEPRVLELADMAGAGCQEFARQWFLINRRKLYVSGSGFHEMWLSIGGSAGHGGCWGVDVYEGKLDDPNGRRWDVTLYDPRDVKDLEAKAEISVVDDARRRKVRSAVEFLCDQDATKSKIKSHSKLSGSQFNETWEQMVESGEVIEDGTVELGNHKPTKIFKLGEGWETRNSRLGIGLPTSVGTAGQTGAPKGASPSCPPVPPTGDDCGKSRTGQNGIDPGVDWHKFPADSMEGATA
ncbi:AAA family ATPase [Blastopirellula sp. J2-11]|uniref:AAA family ATPase n=1 Tax=Blastopirellula sp. J2-11 TaxID=2943192 RepID=UPI0021C82F19|nr:AAA family ATPase [Blastopirellula sp. J2-11]UUO08097.1 AAA family ATPase [Blastopirellula sp. J2-11]